MDSVFKVYHYSTRDIWCMYQVGNVYVFSFENSGRNHILLISYVCSSSEGSIRFHQPWAVVLIRGLRVLRTSISKSALHTYRRSDYSVGNIREHRAIRIMCQWPIHFASLQYTLIWRTVQYNGIYS